MNSFTKTMPLILKSFYKNALTLQEIQDLIPNYMPHKGYGRIVVSENDFEKATLILKEHVGEDEFNQYYPNFLILSKPKEPVTFNYGSVYLGKFDIENLKGFLEKLILETTVIYFYFGQEEI